MYNYLTTQAEAIVIALVLFAVFVLFYVKEYVRKKVFMLPSRKECSLLTAQNWFTILSDKIEYSANLYELECTIKAIETFRTKKFRFRIRKAKRKEYINALYNLYCQKETELQTPIRVELCPQ